jgi:hypothetical protein
VCGSAESGPRNQIIPCVFQPYPPILPDDVRLAARLGDALESLAATPPAGGAWRLFRTLHIYTDARAAHDILDRIHQYCRCIEGLILPAVAKTRQQFKSRTELFIGPHLHEMIGDTYDVRSSVEHLHENSYLEDFDREVRLDLLRKERFVEHIARHALARVLADRNLWPHFGNAAGLTTFWALLAADRRQIWRDPINPLDALAYFDPKYIHDGLLGGP